MNYQELKNAIIEVIRTNGNEEITGEVLQFVLLEMVSSLGKDFQFAGVATPQTEIIERDDKVAWVLGAGTYENFGIPFTVAVDEIAFVLYNGTYRVQKVKTGVIVDDTLTSEGQNPVKGGAIYAEFDKLRAAGYLFAGVATPSLLPPANLTEKIFYLATQGGEYTNLDNITLQKGINIIRFDGTSWIGESLIAITDEVIDSNVSLITAAGVYSGLSGKVDKAEGMGLSQNSYTNTEKSKLGALPTAQELVQMLGGKQDVLTFDTTPTLNSQNPVTSDGIQRAIEAILVLIPSAATALNQLADKSFVNSTAATASATFRGTYNLVSDLSLAVTATHAQIAAALAGAVSGADNNDYCFVQIPTSADTPTEIRVTERYKFNGEIWAYEYDLNNSGFTAAQWEAINSAITSALVTKLSALPTASELATLFAGKQNMLTFDNAPVSGSDNPVKSGGIYDAIAAITAVIPSTATSSNKLVDENALTAYVTGIIGALDASFDLTSADGHVTLKMTQVDGVITTLQILTTDIASAQSLATLGGQVSTNADDIAVLQALYNALQQSAPQVIEPTDTWPVASPSATVIYRVIDRVNTPPQYYSDYMWNGTTMVLMATYNNAIDPLPKKDSQNLVTSGGVFNNMGALDVSELNATENPHHLAQYVDLSAALAAVPTDYQKGGMSIKFVQSSDNKYVQYRLMLSTFTAAQFINTANWQGVDDEPTAGSDNLVKSDGVHNTISRYLSNDYQCFEKYKTDGSDFVVATLYDNSKVYASDYYRSILSARLIGFDETKPHKLSYFGRNASGSYRIIISAYNGTTWSRAFDKTLTGVESGNPGGINRWHYKDSSVEVDLMIDYSFTPDNFYRWIGNEQDEPKFIFKKECFTDDSLNTRVTTLENTTIKESDLEEGIVSNNLANPDNIEVGKYVSNSGYVYNGEGWAYIHIPVTSGKKITFGGFSCNRTSYYAFANEGTPISDASEFTDWSLPVTVTVPSGCDELRIDIMTPYSPSGAYDNLMINYGEELLPKDEYKEAVVAIKGHELGGSGSDAELEQRVLTLEDDVQDIEEILQEISNNLIADLPVSSDGSGIDAGYAYINSSTGIVTVKLS